MTGRWVTADTLGAASRLGEFLHQKGIGCDGHRGDDKDVADEMHRDDAYDILAAIPPDPRLAALLKWATILYEQSADRGISPAVRERVRDALATFDHD